MWYLHGESYGNDLATNREGTTVGYDWEEGFASEFRDFWGPIIKGEEDARDERKRWTLEQPGGDGKAE